MNKTQEKIEGLPLPRFIITEKHIKYEDVIDLFRKLDVGDTFQMIINRNVITLQRVI